MQEGLYPLSSKDVEAVGRSRVNRSLSRNMKIWMWVSLLICAVGVYYAYVIDTRTGMIIMVVGLVSLFVYNNKVDKIRKAVVRQLRREWWAEQISKVEEKVEE